MNTRKQIRAMVILVLLTVIALGGYTLWDPLRADEAEETQLVKRAERGAIVYARYCRICHGDKGEGGALAGRVPEAVPHDRPDLQGRTEADGPVDPVAREQAFFKVYNTIRCGRVGTFMPPWAEDQKGPLNDEQIRQLATIIVEGRWDLAEKAAEEEDKLAGTPIPPENPNVNMESCGQVARGALPRTTPAGEPPPPSPGLDVFTGPVGCTACHAIQGVSSGTLGPDLSHIATTAAGRISGVSAEEYIRASIENPTSFIVSGFNPAMPKLRSKLTDQQYEDLVQFLLSLE